MTRHQGKHVHACDAIPLMLACEKWNRVCHSITKNDVFYDLRVEQSWFIMHCDTATCRKASIHPTTKVYIWNWCSEFSNLKVSLQTFWNNEYWWNKYISYWSFHFPNNRLNLYKHKVSMEHIVVFHLLSKFISDPSCLTSFAGLTDFFLLLICFSSKLYMKLLPLHVKQATANQSRRITFMFISCTFYDFHAADIPYLPLLFVNGSVYR